MDEQTAEAVGLGLGGGLSLVLCGWLVWFTTSMAARGGLAQNAVAGIRTTATQASEEAWVAGHEAALPWARRVAWWSVAVGTLMTVGRFVAAGGSAEVWDPALIVFFAVGYGGFILGLVPVVRSANRAARAAQGQ